MVLGEAGQDDEPDHVLPAAAAAVQQEEFMLPTRARKRARQRARRCARSLAILCRDKMPEPLMAPLSAAAHPEIIEAVVDSGAEDSVAPPGLFPGEVLPSLMSREGRRYRAANGSPIPNLGQTLAHFWDADGAVCGIPFPGGPSGAAAHQRLADGRGWVSGLLRGRHG